MCFEKVHQYKIFILCCTNTLKKMHDVKTKWKKWLPLKSLASLNVKLKWNLISDQLWHHKYCIPMHHTNSVFSVLET